MLTQLRHKLVGRELRARVRGLRPGWRVLTLRARRRSTEHLSRSGHEYSGVRAVVANGLEQRGGGPGHGRKHQRRMAPGIGDERRRCEVVELIRPGLDHCGRQALSVKEITAEEVDLRPQMLGRPEPLGGVRAHHANDVIALPEQELGQK